MSDSGTAGQRSVKQQKGPGEMLPIPVERNTRSINMVEERGIFGFQGFQYNQEMALNTMMSRETTDSQPLIFDSFRTCQMPKECFSPLCFHIHCN